MFVYLCVARLFYSLNIFNDENDLTELFADELSPTPAELQKREQILAGLERFIRKEYNGKCGCKPGCTTVRGHQAVPVLSVIMS